MNFDEVEVKHGHPFVRPLMEVSEAETALSGISLGIAKLGESVEAYSNDKHNVGVYQALQGELFHLRHTSRQLERIVEPKPTNEQLMAMDSERLQDSIATQFGDFLRGK